MITAKDALELSAKPSYECLNKCDIISDLIKDAAQNENTSLIIPDEIFGEIIHIEMLGCRFSHLQKKIMEHLRINGYTTVARHIDYIYHIKIYWGEDEDD